MSDTKTKTKDLLDSVKTVTAATCIDNKASCRIMETQRVDNDLSIWFVTHKSSPKMEQINKACSACIVAFNSETMIDIRLFGKFEVYIDMETKKSVWKDELAPYFKDGIDDTEFTVLKFVPEKIEYRDMKAGSLLPEIENL